ncbi:MAG TPA: protein kinase, partial [Thermoanaerobaculia bacterium]
MRSFEVLGALGAGGMGAVYRARDGRLGRHVALKILQEKLSGSIEYLQRFKREARAASALNHPNIVTIFEIDEFEGAPFIAMELVDGRNLREILQNWPIPLRKLLDIAAQIADGLAAAHERGIVHRDLKPENVMLTSDGRVKIVDFGLAQIQSPLSSDDSTASIDEGRLIGTAAYMSPEQAGRGRVDFRSDQFSLGAILYELATGRRAFDRKTAAETMTAILREEPDRVKRIAPNTPDAFCRVVERCLAKDPSERYGSTRDLARDLRAAGEETDERSLFGLGFATPMARRIGFGSLSIAATVIVLSAIEWRPSANTPPARAPAPKYVAIAPFREAGNSAESRVFSHGLSEAVRLRLDKVEGLQVVHPNFSTVLDDVSVQRVARRAGATVVVTGTIHRSENGVRVSYALFDAGKGATIAQGTVDGVASKVWPLQDQIALAIARQLGLEDRLSRATGASGLHTEAEQALYVKALGHLDDSANERSVDSAIASFHELLETAPDASLVHAGLGRAYYLKYSLKRERTWSEKAARACRRAVTLDPNSPDALISLGSVESLLGNYEEAIAAYRRALSIRPASAVAVIGLAQTLSAAGKVIEAERMFRRGIELNGDWWFGHNELGAFYYRQARYEDALQEFRAVMRLDPDNSWGYTNAGGILMTLGRFGEASQVLRRATAIQDDVGAWINVAQAYFYDGDYNSAAESARHA